MVKHSVLIIKTFKLSFVGSLKFGQVSFSIVLSTAFFLGCSSLTLVWKI